MRALGLLPGLALLLARTSQAATGVDVQVDAAAAQQLGLDPSAIEVELSDAIGGELHLADGPRFLQAMADASALVTKGMGVDYASNFKFGTLGWSVGSGVSGDGAHLGRSGHELPRYGFSLQFCAMGGLSLGAFTHGEGFLSRIAIFGHGMMADAGGQAFDASLLNYGGHLQIKLVGTHEEEAFAWGGIALTGGYEHSAYRLDLAQELPVAGGGGLGWAATGAYALEAVSDGFPVELSTNLRVVFVTAFAGAGMDFNTGQARSAIELTGPITVEVDGGEERVGTATVSAIGRGTPSPSFPRVFGGLQVNLFVVKLYGQLNVGLDEGFGGHAGMRIAL